MGFILSKFRKKKSTYEVLEQLEAEIASISEFKASTVVWQKKVVGYLVTYSIVIYLLLAMLVYFKLFPAAVTRQEQLLLVVPFLVFPGLIWGLRKVLTWWYHRKVRRDDMKLEQLKEKKAKIIDEVMEKETYKVAKQILDKFASGHKQPVLRPAAPLAGAGRQVPAGGGHVDATQLRRRATPVPPPSSSLSTISSPAGRAGPPLGPLQGPSGSSAPPPLPPPARPPGAGGLSRSAPGPPLPRPVLPRERGYLDKFVEFLVADGPSNRFALICRQCQSHNGMALREEFEYVAYRCCYCYYWNPARKQRPVAPRLPEQSALSAASDSSSGSDVSAPASAVQSRRSSILEEDGDSIADPVADAVAHSVADPVADPVADAVADAVTDAVAYPADDKSEVDSSDMEVIDKEDVCEVGSQVKTNEIEEELIVKLNNETTADKLIDAIPNVEDVDANPNMEVDE